MSVLTQLLPCASAWTEPVLHGLSLTHTHTYKHTANTQAHTELTQVKGERGGVIHTQIKEGGWCHLFGCATSWVCVSGCVCDGTHGLSWCTCHFVCVCVCLLEIVCARGMIWDVNVCCCVSLIPQLGCPGQNTLPPNDTIFLSGRPTGSYSFITPYHNRFAQRLRTAILPDNRFTYTMVTPLGFISTLTIQFSFSDFILLTITWVSRANCANSSRERHLSPSWDLTQQLCGSGARIINSPHDGDHHTERPLSSRSPEVKLQQQLNLTSQTLCCESHNQRCVSARLSARLSERGFTL